MYQSLMRTAVLAATLVLLPLVANAQQSFSPCIENPSEGATVVLPPSTAAAIGPSNDALAADPSPDSIAVFTADGTCVGVAAWNDSKGTTISVAGTGAQVAGGMQTGEPLRFRIYDASREVVDRALVKYTACSSVPDKVQSLCRDAGTFSKDAVYVAESIGSQSISLRVDGAPGDHGEDAGWRLLGVPTATPVNAEDLRIGGEAPDFHLAEGDMVMRWNDETRSETGPTGSYEGLSATDEIKAGRGYAVYLFDEPPYTLNPDIEIDVADHALLQGNSPVTVNNLAQTARWHLLSNPYPSGYKLSNLTDLPSKGFQSTIQRYDPSTETWILETQEEAELEGWEAFFVERSTVGAGEGATSLTFDPTGRLVGVPLADSKSKDTAPRRQASVELGLTVTGAEGDTISLDRATRVVFDEESSMQWDAYDASKLKPLASKYALFTLRGQGRTDSLTNKAVESRPWPASLASVPARLQVQGLDETSATLSVDEWSLPDGWSAQLVDSKSGQTLPLKASSTHTIALHDDSTGGIPRFTLQIAPAQVDLPVDLLTFAANLDDEQAELQWQVSSETENAGFHVERRSITDTSNTYRDDGGWTEVGFVEGAGTTNQHHTYQFADTDIPYDAERVSYRLRQVDTDGTSRLSDEVQVERSEPQQISLKPPYPNPARSQATIRYAVPNAQRVQLEVYDMLGRRVKTVVQGRQEAGRQQIDLDTSDLSSGTYFYRLSADGSTLSRKLTIVQ